MYRVWLFFSLLVSLGASELLYDDEGNMPAKPSYHASAETPSTGLMDLGNRVELYATTIDSNGSVLHASGDVLVLFEDQYLSADRISYDREKGELELFDNIVVMQGSDYFGLGEYAHYNLQQKDRTLTPFYLTDRESQVWLSCEKAHALDRDFELESGVMSGCNPTDPLWTVHFSSSDFNSESKWLNIYNARLNVYDVPVFYVPYFGYSLDTTRRTGLLVPSFGLSTTEGFYYEQPIYIAEDDEWDIELRPQIRTKRGEGIYGTLRFVESDVAKGEITTGIFTEKSDYVDTYLLQNNKHYGFNIGYENYSVLKEWFGVDWKGQSGLYSDVNWMNDVDYINLASRNDETNYATTNQVFSRINAFYNEEDNYYGSYFKYYRDLNSDKNDLTLQNLPTLQYHRYLESFWRDHLLANADLAINNLYRPTGKRAVKTNMDIPVVLQNAFFDDYLNLSYQALLNGRYIMFGGNPDEQNLATQYENGRYYRDVHTVDAGTYLTKGYDGFSHAMGLKASYTKAGNEHRDGYYDTIQSICDPESILYDPADDRCGFYNVNKVREQTDLTMTHFIFDDEGRQLVYDRLTQSVNHEQNDRLGEMENEFIWQVSDAITFSSDTFWDHEGDYLSKQVTSFGYNDGIVNFTLSHLFEDKLRRGDATSVDSSYMTSKVTYQYDKYYRYFAGYDYDFEARLKKRGEVGFIYQKRCWDFGIRYVENNRPILQSGGVSNSIYDKYVFVSIMLKPMGGTELGYKFDDEGE